MNLKPTQIIAGLAAGAVLAGGGYAAASATNKTINGCVNPKTHALLIENKCPKGDTPLDWNQAGAKGAKGPAGAASSVPGRAASSFCMRTLASNPATSSGVRSKNR